MTFAIAEARSKKTGCSSDSIKDLRHASNVSTATSFPISFSDKDTLTQTWMETTPGLFGKMEKAIHSKLCQSFVATLKSISLMNTHS